MVFGSASVLQQTQSFVGVARGSGDDFEEVSGADVERTGAGD